MDEHEARAEMTARGWFRAIVSSANASARRCWTLRDGAAASGQRALATWRDEAGNGVR